MRKEWDDRGGGGRGRSGTEDRRGAPRPNRRVYLLGESGPFVGSVERFPRRKYRETVSRVVINAPTLLSGGTRAFVAPNYARAAADTAEETALSGPKLETLLDRPCPFPIFPSAIFLLGTSPPKPISVTRARDALAASVMQEFAAIRRMYRYRARYYVRVQFVPLMLCDVSILKFRYKDVGPSM